MSLSTRPALLGDGEGDDPLAEFRVTDPPVILALLRELRDKSVGMSLVGQNGAGVHSMLWTVDPDQHALSFSADERNPQVQRLLSAPEAMAVGYLESVKIQFELHGLVLVKGVDASALQASLPTRIYRFQRREGFRIKPPERATPKVDFPHPEQPARRMSLRIMDVSIGGCALLLPTNAPSMADGTRLALVKADLDADTRFQCGLIIHHAKPIEDAEGQLVGHKLGCEWAGIDGAAQRALQRYIDLIQRRRRILR